jgi:peroxiredoxin Q/BCP
MRLESGQPAPPFSGIDHDGNTVTFEDFAGRRVVLYFYPAAFTPGCTTESCDFRDRYQTFADAGYEIVGLSPDEPDELARFRAEHDLPFPLVSDPDHAIADAYGAWGIKKNYGREYEGLIRSTIVIADDGTIEHAWYNVKATGHAQRVAGSVVEG